jgi:EAL domain-containing protein (putative c-di-GMP-specific phosphodiesterase class I)
VRRVTDHKEHERRFEHHVNDAVWLIRMVGEDGSIIAPGSFLPIAERYGLISEIDRGLQG